MKTALFLGAGASVFALQPTTKDLLEKLISKTKSDPLIQNMLKNDPHFSDIEQVYASIDEATNFKQSHIYKMLRKIQHPLSPKQLIDYNAVLHILITLKPIIREIILDSFKLEQEKINEGNHLFERLEELIAENGSDKFQIITTNYDLIIYEYANSQGREVVDGFSTNHHSLRAIWDGVWNNATDNPIYLNKLHGSVNWQMQNDEGKTIIKISDIGHRYEDLDVMIAPTLGEKDYGKTPFSELTERFKKTLEDIDVLIVIGFSFRDDKLNKIIKDKLKDKRLVIISISPNSHDDITHLTDDPIILDDLRIIILYSSTLDDNITFHERLDRIYSYESTFDLNTIDGICKILNTIFKYETKLSR